jgi:hypothetical protein
MIKQMELSLMTAVSAQKKFFIVHRNMVFQLRGYEPRRIIYHARGEHYWETISLRCYKATWDYL